DSLSPPSSHPFPYTTLFRSVLVARQHPKGACAHGAHANHADAQRAGCERRVGGQGFKGRDGIAVHGLLQTTEKTKNPAARAGFQDRKSTRLNSSHVKNSYAV